MNGYVYKIDDDIATPDNSSDACESFLESYAKGKIDVGGEEPPAEALEQVPFEILMTGQWAPPTAPDEAARVRELYSSPPPPNGVPALRARLIS
jgi:hypothetical protein